MILITYLTTGVLITLLITLWPQLLTTVTDHPTTNHTVLISHSFTNYFVLPSCAKGTTGEKLVWLDIEWNNDRGVCQWESDSEPYWHMHCEEHDQFKIPAQGQMPNIDRKFCRQPHNLGVTALLAFNSKQGWKHLSVQGAWAHFLIGQCQFSWLPVLHTVLISWGLMHWVNYI